MLNDNRVFWKKFKVIIEKVMRQFLKFVLKYFLSQNFSLPTAMINGEISIFWKPWRRFARTWKGHDFLKSLDMSFSLS